MIKASIYRVIEKFPQLVKLRAKYWQIKHLIIWKFGHYQSMWRRDEDISHYINSHTIRKLQVGCWPYLRKDWLNTELYGSKELVPIDLLKPLPIPDSTFDYIFSEHVHEHFTFQQGQGMLKEFYRVLRKNGKIRIATPDLQFLIDLYASKKTPLQKEYLAWSSKEFKLQPAIDSVVINNFMRAWGHECIYDFKLLKWALEEVGFVDVVKKKPGESTDPHLKNLESHWKSTSKAFNDLESLVIEARKPIN